MSTNAKSNSYNSKGRKDNKEKVKDRRIYTVRVSTRGGGVIYKAWEYSDENMNHHFRCADEENQHFFSFTDIRGKEIKNVELLSGWRYKMTLRWNHDKVSTDGSQGDWQDVRDWYSERGIKKKVKSNRLLSPEKSGNKEEMSVLRVMTSHSAPTPEYTKEHYPSLNSLANTSSPSKEGEGNTEIDFHEEQEDGEEKKDTSVISKLEQEKADLIAMLHTV